METPASQAHLKSVLMNVVEEELDDSFWCVPSTSGGANSVKKASSKAPAAPASGLDPLECRALLVRVLEERTALTLLVHVRSGQPFLLASIHFPHTGNTDLQKQVTTFNMLGLLGTNNGQAYTRRMSSAFIYKELSNGVPLCIPTQAKPYKFIITY